MTLTEHIKACLKDATDASLRRFRQAAQEDAALKDEAKAELAKLPQGVLERCVNTRDRYRVLTQALEAG